MRFTVYHKGQVFMGLENVERDNALLIQLIIDKPLDDLPVGGRTWGVDRDNERYEIERTT